MIQNIAFGLSIVALSAAGGGLMRVARNQSPKYHHRVMAVSAALAVIIALIGGRP